MRAPVKFGISTFVTDDGIDPVSLATAIEDRGFDALVIAEHTHIPASRESAYPGGGELPDIYYKTLDPFVTLAAAAAVTSRIELFTGIALLIQRDPIVTAKEAASVDLISGGRFVFGVGAGWNKPEMRNHGVDPATRHGKMREHVEAMKAIWREDEPEYHGKHVDFDPIWQWPKPVPAPPVFVGGNGPRVEDRVLRYGDGWMPNMPDLGELRERVAALRERAGKHVPVTYYGAKAETLDTLREAGVDRALIVLETAPTPSIPSIEA